MGILYNSFNFSVWLNFFKIKCWSKNKLKTQDFKKISVIREQYVILFLLIFK